MEIERKLLTIPNDILRTPCKPVNNIDSEVRALAQDLVDYMIAHRDDKIHPIGLAAPQLGESIQLFAYYPNPRFRERMAIQVVVNPVLVVAKKFTTAEESCLSIPGKVFQLRRAQRAKIKCLDLRGTPRTFKGEYMLAQIFQHEIDHLNGVLVDSEGELIKEV